MGAVVIVEVLPLGELLFEIDIALVREELTAGTGCETATFARGRVVRQKNHCQ